MAKHLRYKTARCILHCEDTYLLAVHSSFWARPNRRWGLPGGGIERKEPPMAAARREIYEEFDLAVGNLTEVGTYYYKRNYHVVFAAEVAQKLSYYDDRELLDIGWYSLAQVEDFSRTGKLHAGQELEAIQAYIGMQKKN